MIFFAGGKTSQGNEVLLEKIIKRVLGINSLETLKIWKTLLSFEPMLGYFIRSKFYTIMRFNWLPYMLTKIKMLDPQTQEIKLVKEITISKNKLVLQ